MKRHVRQFDDSVTKQVVRIFGERTRLLFLILTNMGDPITTCLIAAAIAVYGSLTDQTPLIISGVFVPLTLLIGAILKVYFERARPTTNYAMNMRIHTYSFPSGHSSGAAVAYGALAMALIASTTLSPALLLSTGILAVVGVGLSRVYLGAHFPSDVIAGWLLGCIMLLLATLVGLSL